jgi:hypothetical protein
MDASRLHELHKRCTAALSNYIEQIERGCSILTGIKDFPISFAERNALLAQRRLENEALSSYHAARNALFEAAKWSD